MKGKKKDITQTDLINKGFSKIGSGLYSSAWVHPNRPDVVIKLKHNSISYDGWDKYARWCQKNSDIYGVPHIYGLYMLDDTNYIASMRRYKPSRSNYRYRDVEDAYITKNLKKLNKSHKKLALWVEEMAEEFPGSDADIHPGNVLIDPETKEYVITDPFYKC